MLLVRADEVIECVAYAACMSLHGSTRSAYWYQGACAAIVARKPACCMSGMTL